MSIRTRGEGGGGRGCTGEVEEKEGKEKKKKCALLVCRVRTEKSEGVVHSEPSFPSLTKGKTKTDF